MKNHPLIAYIKYVLFRKRSWSIGLWIIGMSTMLISWIYLVKTSFYIYGIIYIIAFVITISSASFDMLKFFYDIWKTQEYGKSKIPEKIEEINSSGGLSDIVAVLKQQGKRITELEKLTPLRLGIYAFFLTIFLTVAIGLLLYSLPKLLPQ